jgi:hypothetical protein
MTVSPGEARRAEAASDDAYPVEFADWLPCFQPPGAR